MRLKPTTVVSAHCDLPCGVYDPAQARIEAESVKAIQEKYQGNEDPVYRARAIDIGERLEVLKDYPTPPNCTSPYAPIWITEMVRRQQDT